MRLPCFACVVCGERFPAGRFIVFEGDCFCPSCLDAETVICACCGKRIWRDDALGDSTTPLCEHCEEFHYQHCADCGRLVKAGTLRCPSDDAPGYCETCYIHHI